VLYFGLELHARRFFRIDVDRICQARIYVLAGRLRGKQFGQKKNRKIKGRTAAVIHGLVQMREIPLRLRMLAIFGI